MKALEAYSLKKTYRQSKQIVEAVKNVSLTILPGEVLAFLGPNGAGKTTSIKMMAGLIQPDAGWVRIAGSDPHRNPGSTSKRWVQCWKEIVMSTGDSHQKKI
jgi:ABC-2 type transport system ATP-binding protein